MLDIAEPSPATTFNDPIAIELKANSLILTLFPSYLCVIIAPAIFPTNPLAKEVATPATTNLMLAKLNTVVAVENKFPAKPAPNPHNNPDAAPPNHPATKVPPVTSLTYPLTNELAPAPNIIPPTTPPMPVAHNITPPTIITAETKVSQNLPQSNVPLGS